MDQSHAMALEGEGAGGETGAGQTDATPVTAYTSAESCGVENTQGWDSDDLLSDRITDTVRTAQETNRWGTVARRLRERVLATLKPVLDYRAVLRQFRASILSTQRVLTRMNPNRRYGFLSATTTWGAAFLSSINFSPTGCGPWTSCSLTPRSKTSRYRSNTPVGRSRYSGVGEATLRRSWTTLISIATMMA